MRPQGLRWCPQITPELVITCWQVWPVSAITMGHWWRHTGGKISSTRKETSSSATVSITNPTWTAMELSPGLGDEKPVTNSLNSCNCLQIVCLYNVQDISSVRWAQNPSARTTITWWTAAVRNCRMLPRISMVQSDGVLTDMRAQQLATVWEMTRQIMLSDTQTWQINRSVLRCNGF